MKWTSAAAGLHIFFTNKGAFLSEDAFVGSTRLELVTSRV